jgi:nicotinamidase-related amidase
MERKSGIGEYKSRGTSYAGTSFIAGLDSSDRPTARNTALLLIDHQVGPLWELDFAETRRTVGTLARFASDIGWPIIITGVAPERWGPIIPELTDAASDAQRIVRSSINAWEEPAVRNAIEATNRTKLVIAGGAGPIGVALCALSAVNAGYDVYAPVDASAQLDQGAVARLCRGGVIVTTTSLVTTDITSEGPARSRAQMTVNARPASCLTESDRIR